MLREIKRKRSATASNVLGHPEYLAVTAFVMLVNCGILAIYFWTNFRRIPTANAEG